MLLVLDKVDRMVDRFDDKVVDQLRSRMARSAEAMLSECLDILFFDWTTLYFESETVDEGPDPLLALG